MQYVGRFVSSVYNTITPNINPATLSGAIDVIVVEREVEIEEEITDDEDNRHDPLGGSSSSSYSWQQNTLTRDGQKRKKKRKRRTTELASTPFHVRFGKMSVLRPGERKVTLHLNNATDPLPFAMKVGEQGEAFFVVELDDEDDRTQIPDDLVTSPILSAATSPVAQPVFEPAGQTSTPGEVEPLDLGASKLSSSGDDDDAATIADLDARSTGATTVKSTETTDTGITTPTGSRSSSKGPRSSNEDEDDEPPLDVPADSGPSGSGETAGPQSLLGQLGHAASGAGGAIAAAGRAVGVSHSTNPRLDKLAKRRKDHESSTGASTGAEVDEDKGSAGPYEPHQHNPPGKQRQAAHQQGGAEGKRQMTETEQLEQSMQEKINSLIEEEEDLASRSGGKTLDGSRRKSAESLASSHGEEAYPAPFGSSTKEAPHRSSSNTYPVAQTDHSTFLGGRKLHGLVDHQPTIHAEPAQLDSRSVEGHLRSVREKREALEKQQEEASQAAEAGPSSASTQEGEEDGNITHKSPKRKEDLQYMLDMDGYKMTTDGEDLAFAEGHRLADELPDLSRRHGGKDVHPHIGELIDQAHRRERARDAEQAANGLSATIAPQDLQKASAADQTDNDGASLPPSARSTDQHRQEDLDFSSDLAEVARLLRLDGLGGDDTEADNAEASGSTASLRKTSGRRTRGPHDGSLSDTEADRPDEEEDGEDAAMAELSSRIRHLRAKSGPVDFDMAHFPGDATPPSHHDGSLFTGRSDRRTAPESIGRSRVLSSSAADELDPIESSTSSLRSGKSARFGGSESDPYTFQLILEDGSARFFQMSLCFRDDVGKDSNDAEGDDAIGEDFEEHRVSFQRFVDDPDVVKDERLTILYKGRYLTWENASSVLATMSLYRKTFASARAEEDGATTDQPLPPPGSRASVWSRWWNRNRESEDPPHGRPGVSREASAPPEIGAVHPTHPAMERSSTDGALVTPAMTAADSSQSKPSTSTNAKNNKTYAKTLRLTSDQLKSLNLKKGANTITFSVTSSYSGVATCTARIFLWESSHHIVVSDIDGTITKSDALGHVFTMIGRDWTHLGVAKLYTDIARNGYRIMYLTSRAIGQADTTRDYLRGINQNNYRLPDGPVIMSPDRLIASLHREVILRKPEVFKMACLRDIARLFGADPRHAQPQPGGKMPGGEAGQEATSVANKASSSALAMREAPPSAGAATATGTNPTPFYAGFGNRITDALSYRSVNIPSSRIFTIDTNGEVKMELLELAGYKSSYIHMTDLVDQMFPPITQRTSQRHAGKPEYNDFNYWRPPISEFELPDDDDLMPTPPVSPALSARSGKSVRSITSRKSTATTQSAPVESSTAEPQQAGSRLSRLIGLSRKGSTQTIAEGEAARASQQEKRRSSGDNPDPSFFPESTSAPDMLRSSTTGDQASQQQHQSDSTAEGSSLGGNGPLGASGTYASQGQGSTSWIAPWRRRAGSPPAFSPGTSPTSQDGAWSPPRATSPLMGPVITAEPESEDEDEETGSEEYSDDDDVSDFAGGEDDEEEEGEEQAEGGSARGRRRRQQQQLDEQERRDRQVDNLGDNVLEEDDELLATGEVQFDWRG